MTPVKRTISEKLTKYLKLFPIVVIVGPRQSGKTTFAKMELPEWRYFDMEKPSDYGRISADIEFFLEQYGEHCAIDEAQILSELFPALRSYVDRKRDKKGRIVLLGSVIQHISIFPHCSQLSLKLQFPLSKTPDNDAHNAASW